MFQTLKAFLQSNTQQFNKYGCCHSKKVYYYAFYKKKKSLLCIYVYYGCLCLIPRNMSILLPCKGNWFEYIDVGIKCKVQF